MKLDSITIENHNLREAFRSITDFVNDYGLSEKDIQETIYSQVGSVHFVTLLYWTGRKQNQNQKQESEHIEFFNGDY